MDMCPGIAGVFVPSWLMLAEYLQLLSARLPPDECCSVSDFQHHGYCVNCHLSIGLWIPVPICKHCMPDEDCQPKHFNVLVGNLHLFWLAIFICIQIKFAYSLSKIYVLYWALPNSNMTQRIRSLLNAVKFLLILIPRSWNLVPSIYVQHKSIHFRKLSREVQESFRRLTLPSSWNTYICNGQLQGTCTSNKGLKELLCLHYIYVSHTKLIAQLYIS